MAKMKVKVNFEIEAWKEIEVAGDKDTQAEAITSTIDRLQKEVCADLQAMNQNGRYGLYAMFN